MRLLSSGTKRCMEVSVHIDLYICQSKPDFYFDSWFDAGLLPYEKSAHPAVYNGEGTHSCPYTKAPKQSLDAGPLVLVTQDLHKVTFLTIKNNAFFYSVLDTWRRTCLSRLSS